jgi:hypothetical protein
MKARLQSTMETEGHRPQADVRLNCTEATVSFHDFPEAENNSVFLKINVRKADPTEVIEKTVTFNGPSATFRTPIVGPPGKYKVDMRASWNTNGLKGGFDIGKPVFCEADPALHVEKLQRLNGEGAFTTEQLVAPVGKAVEYAIKVTNTGNVGLAVAPPADPGCDAGTISGGVAGGLPLEAGETTEYRCIHTLTEADLASGKHENVVTVTGTPTEGDEIPVSETTNTVVVEVKKAEGEVLPEGPKENPGGGTPETPATTPTTATPTGQGGTTGTETKKTNSEGGVLGFSSVKPPGLKGPLGCVRHAFRASVSANAVATVAFYLDGRKLKTLTPKNAHHGLISIAVDPLKLSMGVHNLVARITMAKAASATTKPAKASRHLKVLRCHAALVTPEFTG